MPELEKRICSGVLLAAFLFWAPSLAAQETSACTRAQSVDGPSRQIFTCGDTLTFEREPSAALRIQQRANDPAPRIIEVESGAILIEVSPGSATTRIRTPHAIATVRGTTYVVDAQAARTSVFVIEGEVNVRPLNNASQVTLAAGEGVDVSPDGPLTVKSWGAGRAAALLARFGR